MQSRRSFVPFIALASVLACGPVEPTATRAPQSFIHPVTPDAGIEDPRPDAGQPDPDDAGQSIPPDAGQSLPLDAGIPDDAGQSIPFDAGVVEYPDYKLDAGTFNGYCWEPADGGVPWYGNDPHYYPSIPCRLGTLDHNTREAPDGLCCTLGLGLPPGICGGGNCAAPIERAWDRSPAYFGISLLGTAANGNMLYVEHTAPYGGEVPTGLCALTRVTEVDRDGKDALLGTPQECLFFELLSTDDKLVGRSYYPDGGGDFTAAPWTGGESVPLPIRAWLRDNFEGHEPNTRMLSSATGEVTLLAEQDGTVAIGRVTLTEPSSLTTLAVLRGTALSGPAILDEEGTLFLHEKGPQSPGWTRAYAADGRPLWTVGGPAIPLAVFDGTLWLGDGTTRDPRSGAVLFHWAQPDSSVLLDETHAILQGPYVYSTSPVTSRLQILDRKSGAVLFDAFVDHLLRAIPTEGGGILLIRWAYLPGSATSLGFTDHALQVWNLGAGGALDFLAAFEMGYGSETDVRLLPSRLLVLELGNQHNQYYGIPSTLVGLDLPGAWKPALHGWLEPLGHLGRGSPQ